MLNQPTPGQPAGRAFRLTLAYDGTDFFGWQVQPGLRTVQGVLAETVRSVTGDRVLPQGSGRTDTGVHASGQVVSMVLQADIAADRLQRALNRRLPAAVRIVQCRVADPDFHARANVLQKTYEYRLFQRRADGEERVCLPHIARYAWDCRWPVDMERMQQAAADLAGTHDFTSFAAHQPDRSSRTADGEPRSNVRTIFASGWERQGDTLIYRVTGSGFLHHMVRNIVGTCVEVGAARMPAGCIPGILAATQRGAAGMTAPPQGLHLVQVLYRNDQEDLTA